MHALARQNGHVAVGQEEHVARVTQNRRHIGGDEVFAVAQTHHYRRPGARSHDLVRVLAGDHAQREHAGQLPHRVAHGVFQIPIEVLLDQMRDHLRIGFGDELVAFLNQLMFQSQVIFDNAVMHHHDVAVTIAMRVRVLFGRTAMGRPARMADAVFAVDRAQPQRVFQVAQLALRPPHAQAFAVF